MKRNLFITLVSLMALFATGCANRGPDLSGIPTPKPPPAPTPMVGPNDKGPGPKPPTAPNPGK